MHLMIVHTLTHRVEESTRRNYRCRTYTDASAQVKTKLGWHGALPNHSFTGPLVLVLSQ